MHIINPPESYVPKYRIGPFTTNDLALNIDLPLDDSIDEYFDNRFGKGNYCYHFRARKSLYMALDHYNLKPEDEVAILTTTNNLYISGCVTNEIIKFCKWSREINSKTKVIVVNHEFGYPYKNIKDLKKFGLPIIEDCAHSFFSNDSDKQVGKIGDFVIYSFPKMFPIQIGSLLVSNLNLNLEKDNYLESDYLHYVKKVLSHHIKFKNDIIKARLETYKRLEVKMDKINVSPRFEQEPGSIPGVFMFKVEKENSDLNDMKSYVQKHGIESSVFYGESAFFIPVHHQLGDHDLDYFVEVIKTFLQ